MYSHCECTDSFIDSVHIFITHGEPAQPRFKQSLFKINVNKYYRYDLSARFKKIIRMNYSTEGHSFHLWQYLFEVSA